MATQNLAAIVQSHNFYTTDELRETLRLLLKDETNLNLDDRHGLNYAIAVQDHVEGPGSGNYYRKLKEMLDRLNPDFSVNEGWGGLEATGNEDLIIGVTTWNLYENGDCYSREIRKEYRQGLNAAFYARIDIAA